MLDRDSAISLIVAFGLGAFFVPLSQIAVTRLEIRRPWRLPYQQEARWHRLNPGAVRRTCVRAVACARYLGASTPLDLRVLIAVFRLNEGVGLGLLRWGAVVALCSFLVPMALLLFILTVLSLTTEHASDFGLYGGFVGISVGAFFAFRSWGRILVQEKYAESLIFAVDCLEVLWRLLRAEATPLVVDQHVTALCETMGEFALVGYPGLSPQRKGEMQEHVRQVQQSLHSASGKILQQSASGSAELANICAMLAHRLAEQRWLELVDSPLLVNNQEPLICKRRNRPGRDSWIVLLGAVISSGFVIGAVMLGLPVTAVIPAALVFLLGPTMLWGSRALGMGPRQLMNAAQGGLTQQGPSPGQPGQP